jgi:hypothetical protein
LDELVATFDRIASDTNLDSKFCFFIDGLDEYDGNESEVLPMLHVLSANPNRVIALTNDMLYYAHEVKRMRITQDTKSLVLLLDELDRVNSHHARDVTNHWTHARDSPPAQNLDEYKEEGECNFLGLAVQRRLVDYVRVKLQSEPQLMRKHGRLLLDYALRPRRTTLKLYALLFRQR